MACGRVWWWALVVAWLSMAAGRAATTEKDKLLLLMMDGLRWDYVNLQNASVLPGFNRILREGVRAKWTNPLFPSVSYPTWTSLVTGLYAESHNIVGNFFYDPATGDHFGLNDPASIGKPKWWTSEPIWTTAEKAGLRTAQFLWARCDVPIDGVTTHFCENYVDFAPTETFKVNIQRALEKFDEGFEFVQVYNEDPDIAGHRFGPDSEEVQQSMRDLDDILTQLMADLEERKLLDRMNIVIVSDHGMTSTAPETTERHEIDGYLDTTLVEHLADKGAFMNIKVTPGNVDAVYSQVSQIPGVRAYKHADIPDRYHYKDSPYIHDIILLADKGHYIMASHSEKQLPLRNGSSVSNGSHGYDPDEQDMKGIFFARGPAFECGLVVEPIHVVDVYQVLTHVLHLTPQPHNGTWAHVQPIFRTDDSLCRGAAASLLPLPLTLPALLLTTWLLLM